MDVHAFWYFHCPDCGTGHAELGHLLSAHEIHCIVCLEDDGRQVRLRRWQATEADTPVTEGETASR